MTPTLPQRLVAYLVLTVLAIAVVVAVLRGAAPRVLDALPGHCTVGLSGAAVSITFDGSGAIAECDAWDAQVTDGGDWYRYQGDAAPAGAVICQEPAGGAMATVRDQGSLNLYGTSVCKVLANR